MTVTTGNKHATPSQCPFCGEGLDFRAARPGASDLVAYGVNYGRPHADKCAKWSDFLKEDEREEKT